MPSSDKASRERVCIITLRAIDSKGQPQDQERTDPVTILVTQSDRATVLVVTNNSSNQQIPASQTDHIISRTWTLIA
ncbi:hypothetical protein [Parasitella parasitica]|uniref:Uncharacterized protein n=1 Tax=Parasitella parasitica TaxID=35722 RepID=A0A0B7MYE4_9FUNG|nr:hypothetical protein [Parasitella parasitica]